MSGAVGPLVRTIIFIFIVPLTVAVWIPLYLASTYGGVAPEGWAWLGVVVVAAGAAIAITCFASFVLEGRGTPGPWDPPRRLVSGALYARVRNPIYVGIVMVVLGKAILFRSLAVLVWAIVVWALFHTVVLLYEEPNLRARFGAAYEDYLRRTPRWIPRF